MLVGTFVIATLKSFSDNFNIYVILVLGFIVCLFFVLYELRSSCIFVCWITSCCILDISNSVLWDAASCLNPMKNVDMFLAGNWPGYVQTTRSNVFSVGCGCNISSVFKFFVVLFRSILYVPSCGQSATCVVVCLLT